MAYRISKTVVQICQKAQRRVKKEKLQTKLKYVISNHLTSKNKDTYKFLVSKYGLLREISYISRITFSVV